jgi:hypothetical protein
VLGHLPAGEDYHRACLDGTVPAFLAGFAGRGGTDLDSVNALGVADYASLSPAEALARWRAASADNRRRFRQRADGLVDTSIGDYPAAGRRSTWPPSSPPTPTTSACPSHPASGRSGEHGGPATPGSHLAKPNPSWRSGRPARARQSLAARPP